MAVDPARGNQQSGRIDLFRAGGEGPAQRLDLAAGDADIGLENVARRCDAGAANYQIVFRHTG